MAVCLEHSPGRLEKSTKEGMVNAHQKFLDSPITHETRPMLQEVTGQGAAALQRWLKLDMSLQVQLDCWKLWDGVLWVNTLTSCESG